MNIQNQQERRTKWESLVEEQEKSGLSQKDFCKANDLVPSVPATVRQKHVRN